ncbi:MAG: hypothetical protein FJ320_07020 [SAR202 cluster bacterium]|nr:hypothetical protein [SAR202 cluster bacterium]
MLPDNPITSVSQDRLGREFFADQIAKSVLNRDSTNSLIIGLFGPWGAGKSSVVNMIEEKIDNESETSKQTTIIVRFNPWLFSSIEQLILRFFAEIRTSLKLKSNRKNIKKIGDLLDGLGTILAFAEMVPGASIMGRPSSLAQRGSDALKKIGVDRPIHEIKKELSERMRKLPIHLIVMVDDLDRLEKDSLVEMFKLIRLVSDLPHTTYILALDREQVVRTLEKDDSISDATSYLDKIIQVNIDLPALLPGKLESFFLDGLNQGLGSFEGFSLADTEREQIRWQKIFLKGIKPLIRTPRHAIKLNNILGLLFPLIKDEVNVIDYITLEAIRSFNPELFSFISGSKSELLNGPQVYSPQAKTKPMDAAPQILRGILEGGSLYKQMLLEIFPVVSKYISDINFGSTQEWRKLRRVCADEHFDKYFMLTIPQGRLSESQLRNILNSSADPKAFEDYVTGVIEGDGIHSVINYLYDHMEEIPAANIPTILTTSA